MTDQEYIEAQKWLAKVAHADWTEGCKAHVKARRKAKTYRWSPPQWHRDAVAALGRDDIEGFKHIRLEVTLGHTFQGEVA